MHGYGGESGGLVVSVVKFVDVSVQKRAVREAVEVIREPVVIHVHGEGGEGEITPSIL